MLNCSLSLGRIHKNQRQYLVHTVQLKKMIGFKNYTCFFIKEIALWLNIRSTYSWIIGKYQCYV